MVKYFSGGKIAFSGNKENVYFEVITKNDRGGYWKTMMERNKILP